MTTLIKLTALLSLGVALSTLAIPTLASSDSSLKGCPRWLLDYVQFHKTHSHRGDAKYLLWSCKRSSTTRMNCNGLGDRLRGQLYALRGAIASRRLLYIDHRKPAPWYTFWEPNHVDWRWDADQISRSLNMSSKDIQTAPIWRPTIRARQRQSRFSLLRTGTHVAIESACPGCPPVPSR